MALQSTLFNKFDRSILYCFYRLECVSRIIFSVQDRPIDMFYILCIPYIYGLYFGSEISFTTWDGFYTPYGVMIPDQTRSGADPCQSSVGTDRRQVSPSEGTSVCVCECVLKCVHFFVCV